MKDTVKMSTLWEKEGSEEGSEQDDPIKNLEFQKEQLNLRTKASKQSTNEKNKHKPPKRQDRKEKVTDQEMRVLDILKGNPVLSKVSANKFEISSLASSNQYEVTIDAKCDCTCVAKKRWHRNKNCKHILATCVLLGIRKEGLKEFINASERKTIAKQISQFNGNTDENRALFLQTFMASRTLGSGEPKKGRKKKTEDKENQESGEPKKGRIKNTEDKESQESGEPKKGRKKKAEDSLSKNSAIKQNQQKPRQPSTKFLDTSVETYQQAKDLLIQKNKQYRWTVDLNKDSRRLCPNHDPGAPAEEKKIPVGKSSLVAEYLHIVKTKQKSNFFLFKETKYFHEHCVTSFTARCLHADYVNLKPPESIEVDKDFDEQELKNLIKKMNSLHPLLTFLDSNGKEVRIKNDGSLSRKEPQPGLAELRQRINEDGSFNLEDSESDYMPSSANTSFSSPAKKKPRK